MPSQGAIVAVLAIAGLCSSFMFTLMVPIQSKLPELLELQPRGHRLGRRPRRSLPAAVITPISGRLGDMYGKRRIVLVLVAVMVAGSVVAALSPGIVGIIVGRTLQGAIVGVRPARHLDHARRAARGPRRLRHRLHQCDRSVSAARSACRSARFITERSDWHLLFWMAAALGVVVFALVLWIVPVSVLRTAGRFDYVGAAGLTVGLIGILLAISRGNEWGWGSPPVLVCGLGGLRRAAALGMVRAAHR